jgi:signal transduction histidine kinase
MPTFQPRPITGLASAAGYFVLAILLFRRTGFRDWIHRLVGIYLALSTLWVIGHALTIWIDLQPAAVAIGYNTVFGLRWVFPTLILVMTMWFLERPGAKAAAVIGSVWVLFALLVQINIFGLRDMLLHLQVGATAEGLISGIYSLGWGALTISALWLTGADYVRARSPLHRNRLLFWMTTIVVLQAGEGLILLDPRRFLLDVNQLGLAFRLGGAMLLTKAVISYHLPNLRSGLRRVVAALPIALISSGLFFLAFALIHALFELGLSTPVTVALGLGIALVFALLQRPLLTAIQRLLERLLISQRYDPARALREYSAAISNILDLHQLVSVAVGIISEALENRRGALLLTTDLPDGRYDVRVVPGMGDVTVVESDFKADSSILLEWLKGHQPLTQYDVDILPRYRAAPLSERVWLQRLDMEVYVPIRSKGVLIGVFALGHKASGDPYTPTDFDVLMTLGEQTAVALQNARLVTDLKQANTAITQLNDVLEENNRRLEKLDRAKTNFIDLASHELRTPLTQVRGYADILADAVREGQPSPAQMAQIGQGIGRASIRLEEIITAMLDVSQIDAETLTLSRTLLSMNSVLRFALDRYRGAVKERQQEMVVENIDSLPPIQGDFERLCKAFSNVIGNSIKYTPDGGKITISGRVLDAQTGDAANSKFLEVVIADTGIGINKEDQELIFEKFYRVGSVELHSSGQTKFKGGGPGLGLPIARGIIQAHSGKIWVESEGEDEKHFPGSTFHIVLPAAPASVIEQQNGEQEDVRSGHVAPFVTTPRSKP